MSDVEYPSSQAPPAETATVAAPAASSVPATSSAPAAAPAQPTSDASVDSTTQSSSAAAAAAAVIAAGAPAPAAARAPKLAPAPVPEETPWKSTSTETFSSKPNFEAFEPAQAAKKANAADSNKDTTSKRSTTGKEKWVPFAPVVPIQSTSSSSNNNANNARNRTKRTNNTNGGNNSSNNNTASNGVHLGHQGGNSNPNSQNRPRRQNPLTGSTDKRKTSSAGNPTTQARAGHQRTQSRKFDGRPGSEGGDEYAEVPVGGVDGLTLEPRDNRPVHGGHPGHANGTPNHANGGNYGGPGYNNNAGGERKGNVKNYSRPNSHGQHKKPKDVRYAPKNYFQQAGFIPNGLAYPVARDYMYNTDYAFAALVQQIDYYFSTSNLVKDLFLRKHMNSEGLVPLVVVAAFRRVQLMTSDLATIHQAALSAPNIEVIGDKVRAVEGWERWLVPESDRFPVGLENGDEKESKFQVEQAVPFVPKNLSQSD